MARFSHLHLHSHFSLLDGLPKIDEIISYAKEQKMDALALTDHGAMYGVVEFYQKAKSAGIKPIIGEEFYLAFEKMNQRRINIDNKRYHIVLLAKDYEGYQNLVLLTTKAWLEGFYYKPRIDEEILKKHSRGIIALSGCLQGKIPQLIISGKLKEAEDLAKTYQDIFGKENFYLEIQHHPNLKEQKIVNEALIQISKKNKIPLVATNDVHYLKKEDAKAQDILMLINTNSRPDDPERLTMIADDFSFRNLQEMIEAFKNVPEAIENTQKIVELCNLEFSLGKISLPYFKLPNGQNPDDYLKKLCYENLKKRKISAPEKKVIERLEKELSVIKKMGFASYFLIVQDFVNWAKSKKIITGPGRGSVAGSLVAYLLNITEVDPLKYNLLFERFLNPERTAGLPDIDLDFTDRRRDEVIEYVAKKYGRQNVAQIITFGTMAARQVIRDVGRALKYPYSYCDKIAKMIPFQISLDEALEKIRDLQELYLTDNKAREMIEIARKLEGVARHASTHACGAVISNEPLTKSIPLQFASQNDRTIITQYEMGAIESLGLLKMDFLGLKNLTIIEDTLSLIFKRYGVKIDIENISLKDKETYKLLQKGKTVGIFQLESAGMQRYLQQLKPTTLEDLIVMLALYRPGPMALIPDYIARKHKKKRVEYLHPKLKPILESTYGIPIFQEQIMQIAQELAGFTLSEADVLRKAIGKKIRKLLIDQKEKFIKGCKKNKISGTIAQKIWNWFEPFARYSFNKSHSTCYAIIAYQTAYLKAHFPVEFMAVLMNTEQKNLDRLKILLQEAAKMEIKVLPPDINESMADFTIVGKNIIRFGLAAIKNVGKNVVEAIIKEREKNGNFSTIEDFLTRVPKEILNKKSLESLIKAGAFDCLELREILVSKLEKLLEFSHSFSRIKATGQRSLFKFSKTSFLKLKEDQIFPNQIQRSLWEKEYLGVFLSFHPLNHHKKKIKNTLLIKEIDKSFVSQRVSIAGVVSSVKKIITRNNQPMLFVKIEDTSGEIEALVFRDVLEKNMLCFQESKILKLKGRLTEKDDSLKIICEEVEEIK